MPRGSVAHVAPGYRVYPEPRVYGYARPRYAVPVIVYPRPYYAFRPHFVIGFGISIGYPIAYPVAFGYPTYVYGAYPPPPPPGVVQVTPPPPPQQEPPAQGTYGGISLDINPPDATVSVDGSTVGTAGDFSPTHQPLTLTPGRHHIELQAADRAPLAFDVDVVAGQVVPYQGTMAGN